MIYIQEPNEATCSLDHCNLFVSTTSHSYHLHNERDLDVNNDYLNKVKWSEVFVYQSLLYVI